MASLRRSLSALGMQPGEDENEDGDDDVQDESRRAQDHDGLTHGAETDATVTYAAIDLQTEPTLTRDMIMDKAVSRLSPELCHGSG